MTFEEILLSVTIIHLLAAMSPGPDFLLVSHLSLTKDRRTAIFCSLGIALGLSVHIAYSAFGLAAIISESDNYLLTLKIAAAIYFFFLGCQSLRSESGNFIASSERSIQDISIKNLL